MYGGVYILRCHFLDITKTDEGVFAIRVKIGEEVDGEIVEFTANQIVASLSYRHLLKYVVDVEEIPIVA